MRIDIESEVVQDAIEMIKFRIGDTIVDVELETADYIQGLRLAHKLYLQKAENATNEVLIGARINDESNTYNLKEYDVTAVTEVYRNSYGSANTATTGVDPFGLMVFNNTTGMLNQRTGTGSMAIVHMEYMHIKLLETITANRLQYTFNKSTKDLVLLKKVRQDEYIVIRAQARRSIEELLDDDDTSLWIIRYATAVCRHTLGTAYSKFQTLAGASGGITLGGDSMRQEALEEMERLEEELLRLSTSTGGYPFVTG